MSTTTRYPSAEALAQRLYLNSITGEIAWRNGPRAGKVAASDKGRGYLTVRFDGRALFVHRVVFILHTGQDPYPLHIDHINGQRNDNRPENLRAVTNAENIAHRTRLNRNNRSGYAGVYWSNAAKRWVASIKRNRVTHYIGLFDNPIEAARARMDFQV